jgi:hypothetical protein
MVPRRRYHHLSDLPGVIPVFPLASALLLPRARLPLNIFEPRYLAMVDAAMDTHRLIGMIQPRDASEEKAALAQLADVGCVGRITEYNETEDGRYIITLTGIARFRVASEHNAGTPYRQVDADYAPFLDDLTPAPDVPIARQRLFAALKPYLTERSMQTDWKSIEDAPGEMLINALAMLCPFEPSEKQALLEAPDLAKRADTLIALIEIANASGPGASGKPPIH